MQPPVDTGSNLNVHKTFRRRPGRLLKVLCAFNLRPVSTGTGLFIYPLKKSKNISFSDVFRETSVMKWVNDTFRSSPPALFLEKGILKICSKFTGEHPVTCFATLLKSHFGIGVLL